MKRRENRNTLSYTVQFSYRLRIQWLMKRRENRNWLSQPFRLFVLVEDLMTLTRKRKQKVSSITSWVCSVWSTIRWLPKEKRKQQCVVVNYCYIGVHHGSMTLNKKRKQKREKQVLKTSSFRRSFNDSFREEKTESLPLTGSWLSRPLRFDDSWEKEKTERVQCKRQQQQHNQKIQWL